MSAKPAPKLYDSKCTACGTPIIYPFHLCNDCARQGANVSGLDIPKKVKKPEPKK